MEKINNIVHSIQTATTSANNAISAITAPQELAKYAVPQDMSSLATIVIAVVGVLMFFIFVALCIVYINSRRSAPPPPPPPPKKDTPVEDTLTKVRFEPLPIITGRIGEILAIHGLLSAGPLTKSFFHVLEILKESTTSLNWRYKLPCFMMVGNHNSGKSALLDSLHMEALSSENQNIDVWKLFKKAIIFELPTLEPDQDEKTFWSFLSELFIFIRPRRPLDGIIVTIPASDLLADYINFSDYTHKLFEKICSFQHDVNFRLPIYIVITKSDEITGFSELGYNLHQTSQQQIFGWSSPFSIKTAFSTSFTNEMFSSLEVGIRKASIASLHESRLSNESVKIALFEQKFKTIKHSLLQIFDTLIKIHNPEDGLMLRGVYFTGKRTEIESVNAIDIVQVTALTPDKFFQNNNNVIPNYNDIMFFAQDIFSEKIFKESNLAHPITLSTIDVTKISYKNKAIACFGILFLTAGWFVGNYHICNKIENFYKALAHLKTSLLKVKYVENHISQELNISSLNDKIVSLLKTMPIVNRFDLISIFVPQSWFSSLRQDILNTIGFVFDSTIIKAMYIDLNLNTKSCLESSVPKASEKKDLFDIISFQSFKSLVEYVDRIKEIEKLGVEYNAIIQSEDRKSIADLMNKLFHDKPEIIDLISNSQPIKVAAQSFNFSLFKEKIESYLQLAFSNFLKDVFDDLIKKVVEHVVTEITTFEKATKLASVHYNASDIAKLYEKTHLIVDVFKNKNFSWIAADHFSPGKEYDAVINNLCKLDIIGKNSIQAILRDAEVKFLNFKTILKSYKTEMTGPVLSNEITKVSQDFETFQKELKILLDLPFMQSLPDRGFISDKFVDRMLIWDIKRLRELSALIDKYSDFIVSPPTTLRPNMLEMYKRIARKCLYPTVESMLASAENFEDIPLGASRSALEESYARQATNIKNATMYVIKITKLLDEMQEEDNAKDIGLSTIIISQAIKLLQKIDILFNLETPYSSNKAMFDTWTGETDPKFLGINEKESLRQYLLAQFTRIKFLAKDIALPIIDLLSAPEISEKITDVTLIEKWKQIVASVSDYENKKPGNSIAALESFISTTLEKISVDTLNDKTEMLDIAKNNEDFFLSKRAEVAQSLLSRAEDIKFDKAVAAYHKIARYFNDNFANNFPFAKGARDEVPVSMLRGFIDIYNESAKDTLSILQKHQENKQISDKAIMFLKSLEQSAKFLKLWIDQSTTTDVEKAPIKFLLKLRPIPKIEENVESIIDRNFLLNAITIENEKSFAFLNGDMIEIKFDWVASNPERPISIDHEKLPPFEIIDNVAKFSYKGKWALFRMIANHSSNKEADFLHGINLEFDIPTKSENKKAIAKMILKIEPIVLNAGKPETLAWPVLPETAPALFMQENKPKESTPPEPTTEILEKKILKPQDDETNLTDIDKQEDEKED